MKLYDSRRAPNPRRVRWFMAEKGITDVEIVDVSIFEGQHKTPDYLSKAGLPHLPALEIDETTTITESTTTDESTTSAASVDDHGVTGGTTTTSSSSSEATTPGGHVEGLTPPATDTIGASTSSSTVSTSMLLVLAGVLSFVLVGIPAAARKRR